jgi:hypothetical protein
MKFSCKGQAHDYGPEQPCHARARAFDAICLASATRAVAVPSISFPSASVLSNFTSTPAGHHGGYNTSTVPRVVFSQNIALLEPATVSRAKTESRILRIAEAVAPASPGCPAFPQSSGGDHSPKAKRQQGLDDGESERADCASTITGVKAAARRRRRVGTPHVDGGTHQAQLRRDELHLVQVLLCALQDRERAAHSREQDSGTREQET